EFVNYDLQYTLGFVANLHQFNGAFFRSLLSESLQQRILGLDLLWRAFLNYMSINNRWTGPDPKLELAGNVYADQTRSSAALDMNVFMRWMEVLMVAGAKDVNVEFKC
ncbi:hypothetical protein C8F01DRAFT_994841, partial [Mycena amicta]